MTQPVPPVIALSLKDSEVHLSLVFTEGSEGHFSLCRRDLTGCETVPVEQGDLDKVQDFIICCECAVRYRQGYMARYWPAQPTNLLEGQLSLF